MRERETATKHTFRGKQGKSVRIRVFGGHFRMKCVNEDERKTWNELSIKNKNEIIIMICEYKIRKKNRREVKRNSVNLKRKKEINKELLNYLINSKILLFPEYSL